MLWRSNAWPGNRLHALCARRTGKPAHLIKLTAQWFMTYRTFSRTVHSDLGKTHLQDGREAM